MKDEIKEILDNTLEYLEGIDETRNIKILTTNETNILLDYITNLQDTLKDREEYCFGLETQLTNLQEENKKLKELCDKYEEEHSTTFEEWQKAIKENESLHTRIKTIKRRRKAQTAKMRKYREEITNKQNSIVDYKSRNKKAIEYINTHYLNANEPELLNILQGEDKE